LVMGCGEGGGWVMIAGEVMTKLKTQPHSVCLEGPVSRKIELPGLLSVRW